MRVDELIAKLQILVISDPTVADRVVFVEVLCPRGQECEQTPELDGNHYLSNEYVWNAEKKLNEKAPSLTLTTGDR